jgi:hypothetical protein
VTYAASLHDPLADLQALYRLTSLDGYFNSRGQNEKYLQSTNNSNSAGGGYYVLMPTGKLYAWDGKSISTTLNTTPVANLSVSVYDNPALLTSNTGTPIVTSGTNPLYDLKVKYGLVTAASRYNARGSNEYYLQSSNLSNSAHGGLYVLLPNNTLLAWDGVSIATSRLVADLSSYGNVYATPTLLTDASLSTSVGVTTQVTQTGGGFVTLIPTAGFDRTVQVTVTAVDNVHSASKTFSYIVSDSAPIVPTIADQPSTHGSGSLTVSAAAGDPGDPAPLVYSVSVSNAYYDVKTQYGLDTQAGFFNGRKQSEWYLHSSNGSNSSGQGYYVLKSTGQLYAFNSADQNSSNLTNTFAGTAVASLGTDAYTNPDLVTQAQAAAVVQLNRGTLYDIQTQFGLNTSAISKNYRGQGEWYLYSSNGSNSANGGVFVLLPNGKLYAWDGISITTSVAQPALANMSTYGVYNNPSLLTSAQPVFAGDTVSSWKAQFGLTNPTYFSGRGQNEWYFLSNNGSNPGGKNYYVLRSTGQLYAFNIADLNASNLTSTFAGTPVATPGLTAYSNPFAIGQAPAVTATVDGTGQVTLTPNSAFVGTVKITVAVSDGAEKTTTSFLYTVTNSTPVLPTISNLSAPASSGATGATVTLGASDANAGDTPLKFTATTTTLFDIRAFYGLTTADISMAQGYRNNNEKYFLSSNGSNAAGHGYYVLLPNGLLYAFNWADKTSLNLNVTLQSAPVADLSGFGAYGNPALLYNATTAPGLSTVFSNQAGGGTLNVFWSTSLNAGTIFMVTVYVSDGANETQRSFFVTLT